MTGSVSNGKQEKNWISDKLTDKLS